MITDIKLESKSIYLRNIELSDCNAEYLSWLEDVEVNMYLETRWQKQTLEGIRNFVFDVINSNHSYLFAIIEKTENQHIGNIKIGPIDNRYANADISYFIGNKMYWGKGYATEAIGLISKFAFESLNLHRVQAGVFESNIGSIKALEKNGFELEARFREKLFVSKSADSTNKINREDHLVYGLLKHEYLELM